MDALKDEKKLEVNQAEVQGIIDLLLPYLGKKLLPFWLENSVDEEHGGFLTYFDRGGRKSGRTDKTLIMQLRMIFTLASAHRAGYGDARCVDAARQGIDFLLEHFWDQGFGGWYWIANRQGQILDDGKIMYGQSFGIYALSEAALAFRDQRSHDYALKTFHVIQRYALDEVAGGYWEMFDRNWSLKAEGDSGGDRKTFDVHMHLMEAFTTLYELTQDVEHRDRLQELIRILTTKMLEPLYGTGLAQFDRCFNPLPAIMFKNIWGSDRPPSEFARPVDNTNYGHNIEFAWLLKHALDILRTDREPFIPIIQKLVDQAVRWGLDREFGGMNVEGPPDGPATQMLKEFWQQAEALVGFLDAVLIFNRRKYWDAFKNVFDFVWDKMIDPETGEWYALLERDGSPKWDYIGHEWKTSYHTVRSAIQMLERLDQLLDTFAAP